jgi:hypothetical protein
MAEWIQPPCRLDPRISASARPRSGPGRPPRHHHGGRLHRVIPLSGSFTAGRAGGQPTGRLREGSGEFFTVFANEFGECGRRMAKSVGQCVGIGRHHWRLAAGETCADYRDMLSHPGVHRPAAVCLTRHHVAPLVMRDGPVFDLLTCLCRDDLHFDGLGNRAVQLFKRRAPQHSRVDARAAKSSSNATRVARLPVPLESHACSGCMIPAVLANQFGASTDRPVAAAVAPTTPVQATGPNGVHPKK